MCENTRSEVEDLPSPGRYLHIMQNAILAPELLLHFATPAPLAIGDLIVMIDYAGRELGAKVFHIHPDGSITGKLCGLSVPAPYKIGDRITRDAEYVSKAI